MKIISKYKDYYDYLSGIYGVDPLLILDRRKFETPQFFLTQKINILHFYICGYRIDVLKYGNKFYVGNEITNFGTEETRRWPLNSDLIGYKYVTVKVSENTLEAALLEIVPDPNLFNKKENCPILLRHSSYSDQFYRFPKLMDFPIPKILPANQIYLMLSSWLAATKDETRKDTLSDKGKIQSHGFDNNSFKNTNHRIK